MAQTPTPKMQMRMGFSCSGAWQKSLARAFFYRHAAVSA